jgi:hypothetical protein
MKDTITFINETTDMEYLFEFEKYIDMDIENFENEIIKYSDTANPTSVKMKQMKCKMAGLTWEELIIQKRAYLLSVKTAHTKRINYLKEKQQR